MGRALLAAMIWATLHALTLSFEVIMKSPEQVRRILLLSHHHATSCAQEAICDWMRANRDLLDRFRFRALAVDSRFQIVAVAGYESAILQELAERKPPNRSPVLPLLKDVAAKPGRAHGAAIGPTVTWVVGLEHAQDDRGLLEGDEYGSVLFRLFWISPPLRVAAGRSRSRSAIWRR